MVIDCYTDSGKRGKIEGKAVKSPLKGWCFDGQREAGVGWRRRSEGTVQAEGLEPGHSNGVCLGNASSPGLAQMCGLFRRPCIMQKKNCVGVGEMKTRSR